MSAVPLRTCVGCRSQRPAHELVRIVRTDAGIVIGGPSAGRGAWVCARDGLLDSTCVEAAIRRNGFGRSWRAEVGDREIDAIRSAAGPVGAR